MGSLHDAPGTPLWVPGRGEKAAWMWAVLTGRGLDTPTPCAGCGAIHSQDAIACCVPRHGWLVLAPLCGRCAGVWDAGDGHAIYELIERHERAWRRHDMDDGSVICTFLPEAGG